VQDQGVTMNWLGCFDAVNRRVIAASILRATLHGRTIKSSKGSPGCLSIPVNHHGSDGGAALRYPAVALALPRGRGAGLLARRRFRLNKRQHTARAGS
jgi:hypothetical protein